MFLPNVLANFTIQTTTANVGALYLRLAITTAGCSASTFSAVAPSWMQYTLWSWEFQCHYWNPLSIDYFPPVVLRGGISGLGRMSLNQTMA